MDTQYSIQTACILGDYYANSKNCLAAEVCYSLPLIPEHPSNKANQQCSVDRITNKLDQLREFKMANNFQVPPKGVDIPSKALQLLKSFYSLWLTPHIKSDLIKRSQDHARKRAAELIKIFNEVTNKYENIGKLDISQVINDLLRKQETKINNWKGPSFNKLQYKKNAKKCGLTVVMEFKDYRKRCRNSQEDWFKKYDGAFFAKCLTEIVELFKARLLSTDFGLGKIEFAQTFLTRKIQFPLAAARWLLPAGTLFGCDELQDVLNQFHPNLNAKHIKQTANSTKVKDLRQLLLNICLCEYNSMLHQRYQDNISIASATSMLTDNVEQYALAEEKVDFCQVDEWGNLPFVYNDNCSLFSTGNKYVRPAPYPLHQYVHYRMHQHYNIHSFPHPYCVQNAPMHNPHFQPQQWQCCGPVQCDRRQDHHRQFQANGLLQPSHRLHRRLLVGNDRLERAAIHRQQMRASDAASPDSVSPTGPQTNICTECGEHQCRCRY